MRILIAVVGALTVAVLLLPSPGSAARKDAYNVIKTCVSFQDQSASGLTCVGGGDNFDLGATNVQVEHGHNYWNAVRIKFSGGPSLVCMQHTARQYSSKGGFSDNSGLGCVPQRGPFTTSFSINGQHLSSSWYWNRVSMQHQGNLNCLTWDDDTGAGVWCDHGPWPQGKPNVHGVRVNNDWWVNRVFNGSSTLLCPTWGTTDNGSGGVYCFPETGAWSGATPTLSAVKPKGSEWGLNDLRIPGEKRRWCLAWDGGGSSGGDGGLYCFEDQRHLDGSAMTVTSPLRLGNGWDVWQIQIPVG